MRHAQVALTPGRDFGPPGGERFLRLSFASSMADLREASERLRRRAARWPSRALRGVRYCAPCGAGGNKALGGLAGARRAVFLPFRAAAGR